VEHERPAPYLHAATDPRSGQQPEKRANRSFYKGFLITAVLILLAGFSWWILSSDIKKASDEIEIKILSTVPNATISVNGSSYKMPHILKGEKGEKVKVVVKAEGYQPNSQVVTFGNHDRETYIDPD
jgi:hypothetical protein